MRMMFEDLLIQYDVDLFLAGHYHSYVRTCSGLYRSKCNNGGLTHITVGTAGAPLEINHNFVNYALTEVRMMKWGYGKVVVNNSSMIHWSFISSHGDNQGETLDELW